jgi:putative hydrolase of the HAD superfamily
LFYSNRAGPPGALFVCEDGLMGTANVFDVLLFDLGGVLIDFAGFRELGQLLPAGVDRAEVRRRWIRSPLVQRFERAETTPEEFARGVIRELRLELSPDQFLAALVDWARGLYPGARELLQRIPDIYQLACLSNSNELHTPLHRRSMEGLLDRYYLSDEIGLVKPDREIFDHVISDLGVPPGRIGFFDDTEINVDAAQAAGMNAYEVDGVAELEARLDRLGILSPERAP